MSQMINDLLENIYNRIAQMGKAISSLQQSIDQVNENLSSKVQGMVNAITKMIDDVGKEGKVFENIFRDNSNQFLTEIKKLQSNIGLTDLEELTKKLKQIAQTSEETLKPETVDVLLDEVLGGIKLLSGGTKAEKETDTETQEKTERKETSSTDRAPEMNENTAIDERKVKSSRNPPPGLSPPPKK
ncbi:MAG: hypothetical protein ACTSWY_09515 [Promethearchaeota archaeon]